MTHIRLLRPLLLSASFAGEHTAATKAIERALTLNPNSAEAWTAKGWLACYQNDPDCAVDAFAHAVRLSPVDPRGYHIAAGNAVAHILTGEYEQSIEWADRALSEQSRYGPALRAKIVACAQLGRMAAAQSSLRRMLELQPNLTIASVRRSLVNNFPPQLLEVYVSSLRKVGLPEE